jgi:hypothetical protein
MFEQNYGGKQVRWLYWFMGAMAVYALSTLWPNSRAVIWIGAVFASLGIALIRREIRRNRKPGSGSV